MSDDILAILSPIITIIIGVGTLAGFMYKIGEWINNKAEKKASALKEITEKKADEFKKYTDEKWNTNHDAVLTLDTKIGQVDVKLMSMLKDLADRSDLVNGNIKNIRNDIMDVQQDVIELYSADDIEYEGRNNGRDVEVDRGSGHDPLSARKNRKMLEIRRRNKRREIEDDSLNQEHPLYGKGRDRGQRERERERER